MGPCICLTVTLTQGRSQKIFFGGINILNKMCFEVNRSAFSTGISASSALKALVDSAAVKWLEASSWVAGAWLTSSKVALHDTVCRRVTAVHQMPPDLHTHTDWCRHSDTQPQCAIMLFYRQCESMTLPLTNLRGPSLPVHCGDCIKTTNMLSLTYKSRIRVFPAYTLLTMLK